MMLSKRKVTTRRRFMFGSIDLLGVAFLGSMLPEDLKKKVGALKVRIVVSPKHGNQSAPVDQVIDWERVEAKKNEFISSGKILNHKRSLNRNKITSEIIFKDYSCYKSYTEFVVQVCGNKFSSGYHFDVQFDSV